MPVPWQKHFSITSSVLSTREDVSSSGGKRYETRTSLIGQKVGIAYDPADPTTIIVSHPHMPSFTAQPLRISSYCNQAPVLPAAMQPLKPETSRLLDGLEGTA